MPEKKIRRPRENRAGGDDPTALPTPTTRSAAFDADEATTRRRDRPFAAASGRGRGAPALVLSGGGTTYHVGLDRTHTHAISRPADLVELHLALPCVAAYPVAPHPPTGFVPAPTQPPTYGVAGAAPYGVFPNQPQLYATQGPPPPTYDQTLTHPMMYQPMYGQGYPGGYLAGYPTAYGPLQYYPPLAAAAAYYPAAAMQPAPVRPTIMVPNGFDGTRFDGISQPVLPPPPPGVAANAAQLAAMAGHSVALSQKKGSFLGGGTEGGYTFW